MQAVTERLPSRVGQLEPACGDVIVLADSRVWVAEPVDALLGTHYLLLAACPDQDRAAVTGQIQ